jgi:hypothetical protein
MGAAVLEASSKEVITRINGFMAGFSTLPMRFAGYAPDADITEFRGP